MRFFIKERDNLGISKKTSLFMLTWPIFLEMVLQVLVNNVDQMMMSRVSETAVGAIANVNTIMNVLLIVFSVITMASTILIAQFLGSNKREKVSQVYSVAVYSNLVFSIGISLVLLFGSNIIFSIVKLPSDMLREANIYMKIIGGGVFLQGLFLTFSAFFRSNGMMKQGMMISAFVNVLNILGNFILLNGWFGIPKMGIEGVAISSITSRFIGVLIIMFMFKNKIDGEVSIKYLKPFPKDIFKRLMEIGLPAAGEALSYNASQMVILAVVNLMGTTIVTARSYASILVWFAYLYASAISQANQIRVGYLMGAGDIEETYKTVLNTLKPAIISSLIVSITLIVFSNPLYGIFTDNAEILRLGRTILIIDLVLEIGRAFNMVIIRGMQAAGDIAYPIIVGVSSMWLVATALSYVFGIVFRWGLEGVWIAMMLDECIRAVIFYTRWQKGTWRAKAEALLV